MCLQSCMHVHFYMCVQECFCPCTSVSLFLYTKTFHYRTLKLLPPLNLQQHPDSTQFPNYSTYFCCDERPIATERNILIQKKRYELGTKQHKKTTAFILYVHHKSTVVFLFIIIIVIICELGAVSMTRSEVLFLLVAVLVGKRGSTKSLSKVNWKINLQHVRNGPV